MDIVETRWRRYGHDRVYLTTADGIDLGHIDLAASTVHPTQPDHEAPLVASLQRWVGSTPQPTEPVVHPVPSRVTAPAGAVDPPAAPTAPPSDSDLATNRAGEAAWAKRNEVHAQQPILNTVARLLGEKTDERAWRVGAKGEQKVGKELDRLPETWKALHALPVGTRGSDIDHLVIGPAGVFTLNTKSHPGANVWVGERAVMVNGTRTKYLRNSRHEAARAGRLLSNALGREVAVSGLIVVVGAERLTIKQQPGDVHVVGRRALRGWLQRLPTTLDLDAVDEIHAVARRLDTWQPAADTEGHD